MVSNNFILNKTRCLLNEFIGPIVQKADKPRKKFIHQAVGGILLSGISNDASCSGSVSCSECVS